MNSPATPRNDWAPNRTTMDRDALEHLLDRHATQGRKLADSFFASAAARDPRLADQRARIAIGRARLERQANLGAIAGVVTVVSMVATLSLVLHMPVADQLVRILAAGVVLMLFALLTRPVRGVLGLVLPLHLAICLALLGPSGWLAVDGAAGWDYALLGVGVLAAVASWMRDRAARSLDLDEAEMVLKATGRPEHLESMRRRAAAAI